MVNRWDTRLMIDSTSCGAGAGTISVTIRPPDADHEYYLQAVTLENGDGADRDAFVQIYDGTNRLKLGPVTIADGEHQNLIPYPLRIKYGAYAIVSSTGWTDRANASCVWSYEMFSS